MQTPYTRCVSSFCLLEFDAKEIIKEKAAGFNRPFFFNSLLKLKGQYCAADPVQGILPRRLQYRDL